MGYLKMDTNLPKKSTRSPIPTALAGSPITMKSESEGHKALIGYINEHGWRPEMGRAKGDKSPIFEYLVETSPSAYT